MNFRPFATAITAHFAEMSKGELFRVDMSGDDVWAAYLAAFPEGTNPIFRTRTEHDGSYDRAFIRKMGNVISVDDNGAIITIWDAPAEEPYRTVAGIMRDLIVQRPIVDVFRIKERNVGVVRNVELRDGKTIEWFHFNAKIADRHYTKDVDEVCGNIRTTVQVFTRGLTELKREALLTVLDLINEGNLYRGDEFKPGLVEFLKIQELYYKQDTDAKRAVLVWLNYNSRAARLRNTAFGTLLVDLSADRDLEEAVKAYERMVAPTNYKRPTALITKSMVADAEKTIETLGIQDFIERRFAQLSDLNVNDVLWVDSAAASTMKGDSTKISDLLAGDTKTKRLPIQHNISIEDFEMDILPSAISMELFVSNQHQNNLMSLTAPVHSDAPPLFKWGNGFAWSYNGNITDSIKERVKAAGGNTDAKLRVSLAWFNHDDLDLHAECPDGHVYYGRKNGYAGFERTRGQNGQILDVDMNVGGNLSRTPVENLSWAFPKDGHYKIFVHQFRKRETSNVGFALELENDGKITQFSYPNGLTDGEKIDAIEFHIDKQRVVNLKILTKKITDQGISQEKWGLQTEQFVKVNTITLSPNFWGDKRIGNKHWFFILEGCKNDEPTRGIYNEFLLPELEKHRKVFEVLGNKAKCEPTADQLSGLGFSSTKRDKVIAKVTDRTNTTRIFEIQF